jgi:acetoin utilization deacetylase AcuC-like enzyme
MQIFYCDHFVLPLPAGHRFPMEKYALLRERVASAGVESASNLREPEAATDADLISVHDPAYVASVVEGTLSSQEIRRIGFPWSPALVERSRRSVGGTVSAARAAGASGVAANLSGGTHHAFAHRGEGFCVFNDVAVAARLMQKEGRARKVVVLDLDVHQGNGTAAIFRGDPSVFTLSIHGADNYPFRKESGDLDLELPDGTGDDGYLDATAKALQATVGEDRFDLAFYLAGADPYEGDRLGRLAVTKNGLRERDRMVFEACSGEGVPVAVVMGGGYASRVEDAVDIHFNTILTAARFAAS